MKAVSDIVALGHHSDASAFAAGAGSGDVVGPASAADNAVVRFDGLTGKLVQSSAVKIDDTGVVQSGGDGTNHGNFTAFYAGGAVAARVFGSSTSGIIQVLSPDNNSQFLMSAANGGTTLTYIGGDFAIGTNLAETARLTTGGKFLIGTTSAGASLLKVAGSIESTATGFVFPDATTQATAGVLGPASATDNAIARYDATTGKLIQNSAATVGDDGAIRSATDSGANAVTVPLCNWVMQTADRTLNNSAAEQKAFNTTTNGTLTLPTGVYEFDAFLYLTTMAATSGNLAFDPVGAGTAVTDRWGQYATGIDNTTPLAAGAQTGSAAVTQQTVASAVTAATGTGAILRASGMFRVSTGGTIIPSVTLVTAAAAVMKAGSWFRIKKVGESSETFVGAWT